MSSLNTALTTIRRSPYQALVSIAMVSVTFFVGFAFSFLILGANQVLRYYESLPQVIAFFKLDAESSTVKAGQEIMSAKPYVSLVKVVDQADALKLYQETNKDEPLLLELVTADILPASIDVRAKNLDSLPLIKKDLESLAGVDEVKLQEDIVEKFKRWSASVRLIGLATFTVLGGISFLIITVVVAMKATAQKRAIGIMRMIGATKGYIRLPFLFEGVLYGLSGSLIGWLAAYAGLLYLTPTIQSFISELQLLPAPIEVLAIQMGIGVAVGVLLGGFAGLLAVNRLIKQ